MRRENDLKKRKKAEKIAVFGVMTAVFFYTMKREMTVSLQTGLFTGGAVAPEAAVFASFLKALIAGAFLVCFFLCIHKYKRNKL